MYRKKEIFAVLLLGFLCLGVLSAGREGMANAANQARRLLTGADVAPLILAPMPHLSGVVAVPPSSMMGKDTSGGNALPKQWAGTLTPPVFGPNVDASLNNVANQNETTISIAPDNDQTVIASANDYRANLQPWVYRSTNGGTNWTNYQVPGTAGLYYGDPAMAFGRDNHAYFSYLGYTAICTSNGGMYTSYSTDAGATFSPPVQIANNSIGGSTAIFHDKEYVAVDNNPTSPYSGTVYVGWTKFIFTLGGSCGNLDSQQGAPVVLSRSTDHGLTWSVPITASQPYSNNNQGTLPVIGRHGEVYLYYVGAATQSQPNYDSVLFSRSTDGGQTFPFFTRVSDLTDIPNPLPPTSFRDNPFGSMAADQQVDGYLYAVWSDYRNGDSDILLARSTDNGNTWAAPIRVNDDALSNGKDQFFPWIASAPDGDIHISWLDRREAADNRAYKEYYTYSSDHGATWAANIAVSTAPSVPGNSNFIGDYTGLAASSGVVMPIWTDIRSGTNQNAYVARGVYTPESTATPTTAPTSTPTGTSTVAATATLPATATPTACSIQFADVLPDNTFYPFIRCLACRGIINGYPCGGAGEPCNGTNDPYFRPGNSLTRGQLAKIVSQAAGLNGAVSGQSFEDVVPGSAFYTYTERLYAIGAIGGYQCGIQPNEPCGPQNRPYYRPGASVTRGQLTKIVSTAAGFTDPAPNTYTFTDVPVGSTFHVYVERLLINRPGVMSGYPCGGPGEPCDNANRPYFRVNATLTRGQASKIVGNTFFPNCQTPAR